jgi:hypothetical protein
MHARLFRLFAATLLGAMIGCLPAEITDLPAMDGCLVGPDGRPLPGVAVTIARTGEPQSPRALVITDANGGFRFAGRSHWFAWPIFADIFPESVTASAGDGNGTFLTRGFTFHTNVRWFGLGEMATWHAGEFRQTEVRILNRKTD